VARTAEGERKVKRKVKKRTDNERQGFVMSRRQVLGGGVAGAGLVAVGTSRPWRAGDISQEMVATGGDRPPPPAVYLTVSGIAAPIGVGPDDVFFGWQLGDTRRGAFQRAYRLVVSRPGTARRQPTRSVVWDSGRVASAQQAFVSYRGPPLAPDTVYRWSVQTWSASGGPSPFAAPSTFDTGLRDEDWRAKWIRRATDVHAEPDQYTYARTEVTLRASPVVRARAYVASDQQYELYVNGTRVGKGQAYCFSDSQYYEAVDLAEVLRPGANAVGLLYSWQGATKGHPAGEPGVIAQVSILHRDGHRELVTTNGTWRVRKGAWLAGTQRDLEGDMVDYTEHIDGPDQPLGWDEPGFDDAGWPRATVVGPAGVTPWKRLVSVRTRIVEAPVEAVTVTRLSSGAAVADFGKVYAAVPTVTFHNGTPGQVVSMRAGYLLDQPSPSAPLTGEPGQVSTQHGTQHTDMSYSYVQRGGVEQFHPFDYLGFRYFQIDDPGETLAPGDVVALTRHAAVPDEHAASFTSANPVVDAVFELGRHSALFTAQEQFIDTPTREKGPWLWDGFNESQSAMAAFGEQNLTRKSLLEFAQSQTRYWPNGALNKIYPTGLGALDINEFTEIYPEWVWQYWLHTGDIALLGSVYPVLTKLADYVEGSVDPATSLVKNLPSTSIYYSFPVVTRLNVLGVNVFRRTADVAVAIGRPGADVTRQRRRQTSLTAAINRHLSRGDGTYADGLDGSGALTVQASQDTNACALVYGVVPPGRQATVGAYVASLGMQAPPRTAAEVLRALALTGRFADVVGRVTDAHSDGWASILAQGGTFTWEVWEPSDANGDSMSHGWGSNVLVEIQRSLLGVQPTGGGYATFDVVPPQAGLAWATGAVPTPRGTVEVAWQQPAAGGQFALDVTVPPNAAAAVHVPAVTMAAVTESGRALRDDPGVQWLTYAAGTAVVHVGAGRYRFRSDVSGGSP
jgi:alpha-L-rhamnosidase